MGIEPTLSAWEAEVLPLNDAREQCGIVTLPAAEPDCRGADYCELLQTTGLLRLGVLAGGLGLRAWQRGRCGL